MHNMDRAYRKLLKDLNDEKPQSVYVINGAPGSGKSHYVATKKKRGDLVMDMDLICAALTGSQELYSDHKPVLDVALSVRDAVYQAVRDRAGSWGDAYIITAESNPRKVASLARELGGEVITMETSLSQCLENIHNDKRRAECVAAHVQLARDWYKEREKNE